MQILNFLPKHEIAYDRDSLYLFLRADHYITVEKINQKTLFTAQKFSINISMSQVVRPIVDDNFIYLIDNEAHLFIVDKFSGEIFHKINLNSICVCNVQNTKYVYALCIVPIYLAKSEMPVFLIQKINKETGEILKLPYHQGYPTSNIILIDDDIITGSNKTISRLNQVGEELWTHPFKGVMNNPLIFNESILASSKSGLIQIFDSKTGKNQINFQLIPSDVLPIFNNRIIWLKDNSIIFIDINKAMSNHSPGEWQTKMDLPISNVLCALQTKNHFFVGNNEGKIANTVNGKIYNISNKPIYSIKQFPSSEIINCEDEDNIYFLDYAN